MIEHREFHPFRDYTRTLIAKQTHRRAIDVGPPRQAAQRVYNPTSYTKGE